MPLLGAGTGSARTASAAASSRPAGKIQILVYGDAQNGVEQYAVKAYNKTREGKKVKAVLCRRSPAQYYQAKLQTIMSSSKAPDVFFNWGGGSIAAVPEGRSASCRSTASSSQNPKLKSSFLPSILSAAKIGGNYYGIPMRGTQPVLLFYNKALLSQDGAPVPKTWAQLLSDVSTLKNKGVSRADRAGRQVTSGRR